MKTQPIYADLPELYRSLFPAFFEKEIPIEENATCNDCAMCQKAGEPAVPGIEYFKPDVKCCSYYPKLPNYLVGGLLTDTNPAMEEGRRRIRERIQTRIAVTPQAVDIPKRFNLLHKSSTPRGFGRSSALICPYYVKEGGLCSIWKFRDCVCSTYFCKTMAGNQGQQFWTVLRRYLNQAQDILSWYVLYEMNWDVDVLLDYVRNLESGSLELEDLDLIAPPEEKYKKIWGEWTGMEEEFYCESFRLVSKLSREEFDRLSGMHEKLLLRSLKDKHNNVMNPKIPPILRKNPALKAFPMPDNSSFMIKTDVGFFTLQQALFDVVGWFDGVNTTEEIKKLVFEKYEDDLTENLLLSLYFNGILLPA